MLDKVTVVLSNDALIDPVKFGRKTLGSACDSDKLGNWARRSLTVCRQMPGPNDIYTWLQSIPQKYFHLCSSYCNKCIHVIY